MRAGLGRCRCSRVPGQVQRQETAAGPRSGVGNESEGQRAQSPLARMEGGSVWLQVKELQMQQVSETKAKDKDRNRRTQAELQRRHEQTKD